MRSWAWTPSVLVLGVRGELPILSGCYYHDSSEGAVHRANLDIPATGSAPRGLGGPRVSPTTEGEVT